MGRWESQFSPGSCEEKILNISLFTLGGLLLPSSVSLCCSSCLMGEKRIFVGSPGFFGQSRAHPKISFPPLHQLFTFVFHWLGPGSSLGHSDQDLSAGSCFLQDRQSFPLKAWWLKYSECTGCSSSEQGTHPGLGQQQQAWAGAPGSHCGASQGWDIPRLCLGRWELLAGQAGDGVFLENFLPLLCCWGRCECPAQQSGRTLVQASVSACVCPLALCHLPIKWVLT